MFYVVPHIEYKYWKKILENALDKRDITRYTNSTQNEA